MFRRPSSGNGRVSGFSFYPTWMRTLPVKLARVRGVAAVLAVMGAALTSPSYAQAPPPLGSLTSFGVLAGQSVTNTGPTTIFGDVGIHPGANLTNPPGNTIGAFPPGLVTGTIYDTGPVALAAQNDLTTAYNNLAGRPPGVNMSGLDLGGQVLVPGVYNFSSSAQLTGTLALNGLGNPNSVFIFNIGSALTTASASRILLINGASGANVFWQVGSSAFIGTGTQFTGDILALTSISLLNGANITCGAAWARNGSVTLDTNNITLGTSAACAPAAGAGGINPQTTGEVGTGTALAGIQAMNSFLSLVANPFDNNRPFAETRAPDETRPQMPIKAPIKALGYGPESPRRWGIWGAAYGGQTNTAGNLLAGTHDSSARTFGFATGLDYLATPYTVVGFALAGGGTNYGLSDGLGSGHSDMFQAAVYSTTRVNAAYVSATLAYAWHRVSTDRYVTIAGNDHLTSAYAANSFGGRIEGGYRFVIPAVFDSSGFGLTPYAALQAQSFHTPSYSETAVSGSPLFALAYNAHTTTAVRTELGSWVDKSYTLDRNNVLSLFGRAAWAHDWYSDPSLTAAFQSALPGSIFIVNGVTPAKDSALLTGGAQLYMRNGWAVMAKLDTEFAQGSHTYMGTARLRYTW